MQIFTDISQVNIEGDSAVVIGKFDGLHLGHRFLIREMISKTPGLKHLALMVRRPGGEASELVPFPDICRQLERLGVDYLVRLELDHELMNVSPEDFLQSILVEKLHMKQIFAGADVAFGRGAAGNADFLRANQEEYGYKLSIINKEAFEGSDISSTRIRDSLSRGENFKSQVMLGLRPNALGGRDLDGLIIIDKPVDFTSQDVISKLRGMLHQKKIGHTGTLDPGATGVLPVLLGRATRLSDMLMSQTKVYETTMTLGVVTDTQDMEGRILESRPVTVSNAAIERGLKHFTGEIEQIPPMYSAIKIKGQKLYDLARRGIEVERQARRVNIEDIELLDIKLPEVKIRVKCSKGTYIRTLCHDIGAFLGCGAAMKELRRTASGDFSLDKSITLDRLQQLLDEGQCLDDYIVSLEDILGQLPAFNVEASHDKALHNGNEIRTDWGRGYTGTGETRMYDSEGRLVGLFRLKEDRFRPEIML